MNTKNLMNAIGGISDKHVEACAEAPAAEAKTTDKITEIAPARAKRPKRWIPILAAAAAVLLLALAMIPMIKKLSKPQGEIDAHNTAEPTAVPTAGPTAAPTPVPTEGPTALPPSPPETQPITTNPPLEIRPVKLGGGHTATFTLPVMLIHTDFELPEGFELRTEKADETHIPFQAVSLGSVDFGGYIYDADGVLVGGFQCWPYDDDSYEENVEWVYSYFRSNHWGIMIEEGYEPIEADGPCIPALTLSEGVDVIPGQNFAANGTFVCDAVVAYEPEQNLTIEIVFDQGVLTHDQLVAVGQSIRLEMEDRDSAEPTPEPEPELTPEATAVYADPLTAARTFAEAIGQVHEQQFDLASAEVLTVNQYYTTVIIPCVTYPDEVLEVTVENCENGYRASWESARFTSAEGKEDEFFERIGEGAIEAKLAEFAARQITVTAADIRDAGCSAEIGSVGYMSTAAALYADKLASYYRIALSKDNPFCCYDVRWVGTERDTISWWKDNYIISIGFRVRDILPFSHLFDYIPCFDFGSLHPRYEGWLVGWTLVTVELDDDGSFTANAVLNGAG